MRCAAGVTAPAGTTGRKEFANSSGSYCRPHLALSCSLASCDAIDEVVSDGSNNPPPCFVPCVQGEGDMDLPSGLTRGFAAPLCAQACVCAYARVRDFRVVPLFLCPIAIAAFSLPLKQSCHEGREGRAGKYVDSNKARKLEEAKDRELARARDRREMKRKERPARSLRMRLAECFSIPQNSGSVELRARVSSPLPMLPPRLYSCLHFDILLDEMCCSLAAELYRERNLSVLMEKCVAGSMRLNHSLNIASGQIPSPVCKTMEPLAKDEKTK